MIFLAGLLTFLSVASWTHRDSDPLPDAAEFDTVDDSPADLDTVPAPRLGPGAAQKTSW